MKGATLAVARVTAVHEFGTGRHKGVPYRPWLARSPAISSGVTPGS